MVTVDDIAYVYQMVEQSVVESTESRIARRFGPMQFVRKMTMIHYSYSADDYAQHLSDAAYLDVQTYSRNCAPSDILTQAYGVFP